MRMRKGIQMLVMAALALFILTGTGVSAQADTIINRVDVTVTPPLVGDTDTSIEYFVDSSAGYTVTADGAWKEGGSYDTVRIEEGNVYIATFTVTAKAGYTFAQDTSVYVNESQEQITLLGGEETPYTNFELKANSVVLDSVTNVALPAFSAPSVGSAAPNYPSHSDSTYKAEGV